MELIYDNGDSISIKVNEIKQCIISIERHEEVNNGTEWDFIEEGISINIMTKDIDKIIEGLNEIKNKLIK